MTSWGRVIGALTSFIYTFTSNIHIAAWKRMKAEAEMDGQTMATAAARQASIMGVGFAVLFAGQFVQTIAREAIFSREQWEKREDEDELMAWLLRLAGVRTGALGALDIPYNVLTGLRYERDLTSLTAGAGFGYMASQIQSIMGGIGLGGRNSENTNTAEHQAAKALYRLLVIPGISFTMSMIPLAGPVTRAATTAGLQYGTSGTPTTDFADALVGERDNN
jgi:hypothetical protein